MEREKRDEKRRRENWESDKEGEKIGRDEERQGGQRAN
jgi:hypothetical protein